MPRKNRKSVGTMPSLVAEDVEVSREKNSHSNEGMSVSNRKGNGHGNDGLDTLCDTLYGKVAELMNAKIEDMEKRINNKIERNNQSHGNEVSVPGDANVGFRRCHSDGEATNLSESTPVGRFANFNRFNIDSNSGNDRQGCVNGRVGQSQVNPNPQNNGRRSTFDWNRGYSSEFQPQINNRGNNNVSAVGLEPSLEYRVANGSDSSLQNKIVPEIRQSSFDQYGAHHHKIVTGVKGNNPTTSDYDQNWRKGRENGHRHNFQRSNSPYPGKNAENSQSNAGVGFFQPGQDSNRPVAGQSVQNGGQGGGSRSRDNSAERRVHFSGNDKPLNRQ
ncbi:unnamed protein product [Allacma fusca]|uniref:Uncharacterized protein n=1 Tax=Allacma fusca TaxID=39272 RepID=A0A8J2KGI5_9HEXA|nr:unnamed protein product [Allacma fusca]